MWCHSRTMALEPSARQAAVRPDERVGDRDRQRTAALLADAAGAGLLSLDELDARLTDVWRAGVAAELAALEADLPAALRRERDRREAARHAQEAARAGLGHHLAWYLAVLVLLVTIWLVAGMSSGAWYPWPIWPALGWGFGVAGHVRAARRAVA